MLAGMRGFQTPAIEDLILSLELKESSGDYRLAAARRDLLRLYERAKAFVYPSTFEGFGMPVLEALAAGIPVACSDIPPIKEVAGDAALFFDPLDEEAMAAALDQILNDQPLRGKARQGGSGAGAAIYLAANGGANFAGTRGQVPDLREILAGRSGYRSKSSS